MQVEKLPAIVLILYFSRVYCKYHYLEGHEFKTPEDELREFLNKMMSRDWKFYEQYPEDEANENSSDDRRFSFLTRHEEIFLNHDYLTCS